VWAKGNSRQIQVSMERLAELRLARTVSCLDMGGLRAKAPRPEWLLLR
jgi:hypothetical protein